TATNVRLTQYNVTHRINAAGSAVCTFHVQACLAPQRGAPKFFDETFFQKSFGRYFDFIL
ncbi:hypothetical protein LJC60_11340, partial [Ruminococcaceae bacterium OttesenSCG-928-D13]|nr:hypothetical protein [Ruminococcaceae bacterium OttesenSCG-928-D13]